MRRFLIAALVVVSSAAIAHLGGDLGLGAGLSGGDIGLGALLRARATITITSPSTDPANADGRSFTVSGATTGSISSVTFSLSPSTVTGTCSTGAATFSCTVTLVDGDDDDQTVTVSANSGAATDTVVVKAPVWDFAPGATTVADLSDTLLVNNGTQQMTLAYKCLANSTDVTQGGSWTCRDSSGAVVDTLTLASTGTDPTVTSDTPWGASHATLRGVQCKGGKYYLGTVNGLGALGTNDVAIELVYSAGTLSTTYVGDTPAVTPTTTKGWRINEQGANSATAFVADGTAQSVNGSNGANTAIPSVSGQQRPNHLTLFWDFSALSTNGYYMYGSDLAARASSNAAAISTTTSVGPLAICAAANAAEKSTTATIYALRVWKCNGCMGGNTQNLIDFPLIEKTRAAIALGYAPRTLSAAAPTTIARASEGTYDVDGYLYTADNGQQRVARRSGVSAYVNEPAVTNIWDLSIDSTNAAWTKTNCAATDGATAPDKTTRGDTLESTDAAGVVEHLVSQAQTLTATTYALSCYVKKPTGSTATHAWLRNATIANGTAWFDLSTCAAATTQAGVTTYSQALADGWCRIGTLFTGTAASHTLGLGWSLADGVLTYDDGTNSQADLAIYQCDLAAFPSVTSPIVTTSTASVSRAADDLRWSTSGIWTGSTVTTALTLDCPNYTSIAQSTPFTLGVGGSEKIKTNIATTDRHLTEVVSASTTTASITAAPDVTDGATHVLRTAATTNNAQAWTDTTSLGTDNTVTMPSPTGTFFYYGTNGGTAAAAACPIVRSRLWLDLVTPTEAP